MRRRGGRAARVSLTSSGDGRGASLRGGRGRAASPSNDAAKNAMFDQMCRRGVGHSLLRGGYFRGQQMHHRGANFRPEFQYPNNFYHQQALLPQPGFSGDLNQVQIPNTQFSRGYLQQRGGRGNPNHPSHKHHHTSGHLTRKTCGGGQQCSQPDNQSNQGPRRFENNCGGGNQENQGPRKVQNNRGGKNASPANKKPSSSVDKLTQAMGSVQLKKRTWSDPAVVQFCKNYKVMYIMRGLPGSGKSTLAKQIAHAVGNNSVVCSADDFRLDDEGNYRFDVKKMGETHRKCIDLANQSCKASKTVIVDNTNIKSSEVKVYLNVARKHNYDVILLKTAEWNVDVCTSRNIHSVPQASIQKMKSNFQFVFPDFFGWSVPPQTSDRLRKSIQSTLCSFQKQDTNLSHFLNSLGVRNDLSNLYTIFTLGNGGKSYSSHVTAFFPDKGSIEKYAQQKHVAQYIGNVSKIAVIGICMTERTLSARVLLTEQQKAVWSRNDDRGNENAERVYQRLPRSVLRPEYGKGNTAHITLGVTTGAKALQAKLDLFKITQCEFSCAQKDKGIMNETLGYICDYDKDFWVVYLKEPINVDAIFVGAY